MRNGVKRLKHNLLKANARRLDREEDIDYDEGWQNVKDFFRGSIGTLRAHKVMQFVDMLSGAQ